jgi:hypothetical protein
MSQPVPAWVSFDAVKTVALDLLGLRAPVQQISNELFNGVTTITPKLRYLFRRRDCLSAAPISAYCWVMKWMREFLLAIC